MATKYVLNSLPSSFSSDVVLTVAFQSVLCPCIFMAEEVEVPAD